MAAHHDPLINFFDSPGGPKGSKGAEKSMMVLTAKEADGTIHFEDSHGNIYVGNEGMAQVMILVNKGQDILIHSDLIFN